MVLDIKTLLVCDITLSLVFFAAFTAYFIYQQPYPGFKTWTMGILLHAMGILLLLLHGAIPPAVSAIGANTIIVLAVILMLDGVHQFERHSRLHPLFYLIPVVIGIYSAYSCFMNDHIVVRNMISATTIFFLMLTLAWQWLRHGPASAAGLLYSFGAVLILFSGVSLMARALHWLFSPEILPFAPDNHNAFHIICTIIAASGVNIVFLLMNTQRARRNLLEMHEALSDSESRYRQLANASFESIVFTREGKIVDVNDNTCRLFGCAADELIGRMAHDFVVPEDRDLERHQISAGIEQPYEVTGLKKDGTPVPLEIQGKTFLFKGVTTRVAALHDITARKNALKILQERDRLYSALFATNASVMLLIDSASAAIVDANNAACSFYGYTQEQLRDLKITDLNTLTKEETLAEIEQAATEKRKHFNFAHRLANGEIREVEVFTGPIIYESRSLLCSVVHDITQRKLDQLQREKLISSLQQALQEIKTLRGILPICSHCKKIRDDKGSWSRIEHYVREHSEATFSHGICPDCVKEHYPQIADEVLANNGK